MTEYGLCLWTFGSIDFEEKCRLASEIGVDGVEVQGNIKEDPKKIKSVLQKYNLKALSITPEDLDISSSDAKERQQAIEYYLKLVDWATKLEVPRFCLHGQVGKINWDKNLQEHWKLLVDSVKIILNKAQDNNLEVVYEVLNRYENYQVLTAKEGLKLISEVNNENLKLLLDAYHMNIEEENPASAIDLAGEKLGVYHVADSNRQAVGNGHTDFAAQFVALKKINYVGPIIMEISAAGPNPFTPMKENDYLKEDIDFYKKTLKILKKNFD
ncbi:sugar phosphate isomerase/epimerase family protein [Liquorilactobacillus sicerae]|uniref:sugar phosphate isomerase/epimerase family protein n=1 Tax=Liquorilactobacillus sicerae TaxID=1416943 RepID=UPI0024818B2A|nr:sugar phosphate isomerase/epimerase family protein [Liquorilactobacillus sicerae]